MAFYISMVGRTRIEKASLDAARKIFGFRLVKNLAEANWTSSVHEEGGLTVGINGHVCVTVPVYFNDSSRKSVSSLHTSTNIHALKMVNLQDCYLYSSPLKKAGWGRGCIPGSFIPYCFPAAEGLPECSGRVRGHCWCKHWLKVCVKFTLILSFSFYV